MVHMSLSEYALEALCDEFSVGVSVVGLSTKGNANVEGSAPSFATFTASTIKVMLVQLV